MNDTGTTATGATGIASTTRRPLDWSHKSLQWLAPVLSQSTRKVYTSKAKQSKARYSLVLNMYFNSALILL